MKRTKNQVIRDASFAAQALCAANQIKPKARSFCPSHTKPRFGKITNAFATAQPRLFYLISPEAARLTVLSINQDYSQFYHPFDCYYLHIVCVLQSVSKKASDEIQQNKLACGRERHSNFLLKRSLERAKRGRKYCSL
jgi:hypothetical protein